MFGSFLTRLAVAALLVESGLRAIRRGGAGRITLGAVLEAIALFTLAITALAGMALLERWRRPPA